MALAKKTAKARLWSSYDGFKDNLVHLTKGVSGVCMAPIGSVVRKLVKS